MRRLLLVLLGCAALLAAGPTQAQWSPNTDNVTVPTNYLNGLYVKGVPVSGGIAGTPTEGDQVLISDSTSTGTWKTLPNCIDTVGQHLNYTAATNTWSCGTSSSGTSSSEFHIRDYATPNDGLNDTAGFQAALNALKAFGGGTLIIDPGTWNINGTINLSASGNPRSYIIQGSTGAVISLGAGIGDYTFYMGNFNQFVLRDLTFVATSLVSAYDTGYVVFANTFSGGKVLISGCQFFGITAKYALVEAYGVDTIIENSQFWGSGGDVATVHASSTLQSLTVRDTFFQDYGSLGAQYYSKIGANLAWIKVDGPASPSTAALGPFVVVERSRFDEGAQVAVQVLNVPQVTVRHINVNMSGTGGGVGVRFDNVTMGHVEFSTFGYAAAANPAISAFNNSVITKKTIRLGGGITCCTVDGTSTITAIP